MTATDAEDDPESPTERASVADDVGSDTSADPDAEGAGPDAAAADAESVDPDTEETHPDVPDWDDEYVDRVSDRIMYNYDLEKDVTVRGEPFTLEGELRVQSHKQFFHPMITYGHQHAYEYLFVRERGPVRVADFERFASLAHELADERVDADEEHYATDFTFAAITDDITDDVRAHVEGFSDRTLLKYGYHGHYEVHLAVVDPDAEELVVSENADIADALAVWAPIEPELGFVERLKRRLLG